MSIYRGGIALLIASALACAAAAPSGAPIDPSPPPSTSRLHLLFLGNSLTYTYDVPGQVAQLAAAAGELTPVITNVTVADNDLEDQWNSGVGQADLAATHYDILIMQQGPSTLPASGVNLTQWVTTWSTLADSLGTRPALYVVWPPLGGDLNAGIANYEAAANAAGTAIYPVAEAWRQAWKLDSTLPLYGPDQFHPAVHGAWLAALVITATIYNRAPADFPNLFPDQISAGQAATLRQAAATAIAQYGRR